MRKPFPDDIERERVVIAAPTNCQCCGGSQLAKLGEDVTETLEVIPRRWKVIETVREKFTCRDCEAIRRIAFWEEAQTGQMPRSGRCSRPESPFQAGAFPEKLSPALKNDAQDQLS